MATTSPARPQSIRWRAITSILALVTVLTWIVALAAPAGATTTPSAVVIDGCTIVTSPSHRHHTVCPSTTFTDADLANVDLDYADLAGADLSTADLAGARLGSADLRLAKVGNCTLVTSPVSVVCHTADLVGTDLKQSDLAYANLAGADLDHDDLVRADLTGAAFGGCLPIFISPGGCDLATMVGADLFGANFSSADTSTCYTLTEPEVGTTSLCGGVDLTGADLDHANFTDTDLTFAVLAQASLEAVTFSSTDFSACPEASTEFEFCQATSLVQADLRHTSLAHLSLRGVSLQGADLRGDNLTGTDLSPVMSSDGLTGQPTRLDGANLHGVNLTSADLSGASTTGTSFAHATWASTTCPDGTNSNADGGTCLLHLT